MNRSFAILICIACYLASCKKDRMDPFVLNIQYEDAIVSIDRSGADTAYTFIQTYNEEALANVFGHGLGRSISDPRIEYDQEFIEPPDYLLTLKWLHARPYNTIGATFDDCKNSHPVNNINIRRLSIQGYYQLTNLHTGTDQYLSLHCNTGDSIRVHTVERKDGSTCTFAFLTKSGPGEPISNANQMWWKIVRQQILAQEVASKLD